MLALPWREKATRSDSDAFALSPYLSIRSAYSWDKFDSAERKNNTKLTSVRSEWIVNWGQRENIIRSIDDKRDKWTFLRDRFDPRDLLKQGGISVRKSSKDSHQKSLPRVLGSLKIVLWYVSSVGPKLVRLLTTLVVDLSLFDHIPNSVIFPANINQEPNESK